MAKKNMLAREKKRTILATRNLEGRSLLKQVISSVQSEGEDRWNAVIKLQKRLRDESPCRGRNRCVECGRPRGVLRRFELCRCCLRKAWMRGDVPGLVKASW